MSSKPLSFPPPSKIESGVLSSVLCTLSMQAMDYLSVIQPWSKEGGQPLLIHAVSGGSLSLDEVGSAILKSFQRAPVNSKLLQLSPDVFWDQLILDSAPNFHEIAQRNIVKSNFNDTPQG